MDGQVVSTADGKVWYRNGLVWAIILLVVFLGSFYISAKIWEPTPFKTVKYGPFEFVKAGGFWNTDWTKGGDVYHLRLRHNPKEVENVTIDGVFDPAFNRPDIYITFNPTEGNFTTLSLAAAELSINMVQALGAHPIAACIKNETDACSSRPIVNCGDANRSVIFLSDEGDARIAARGECLILKGADLQIMRSVDRLLFVWYKMMPVIVD